MLYNPKWEVQPWQETLLDAADQLERRGWCQGRTVDNEGRMCALGALIAVAGHATHDEWLAHVKLQEVVGDRVDLWNDAPERTKEDVVAAFRQAATL